MISDTTLATYILLAAAICAAWAKPVALGRIAVAPWLAVSYTHLTLPTTPYV